MMVTCVIKSRGRVGLGSLVARGKKKKPNLTFGQIVNDIFKNNAKVANPINWCNCHWGATFAHMVDNPLERPILIEFHDSLSRNANGVSVHDTSGGDAYMDMLTLEYVIRVCWAFSKDGREIGDDLKFTRVIKEIGVETPQQGVLGNNCALFTLRNVEACVFGINPVDHTVEGDMIQYRKMTLLWFLCRPRTSKAKDLVAHLNLPNVDSSGGLRKVQPPRRGRSGNIQSDDKNVEYLYSGKCAPTVMPSIDDSGDEEQYLLLTNSKEKKRVMSKYCKKSTP